MASIESVLAEKSRSFLSRLLRFGSEHHVFRIGNFYYKFPNYPELFFGAGRDSYLGVRRQRALVTRWFGPHFRIAETDVRRHGSHYFIRQRAVAGTVTVTLGLLASNPEVRRQLVRLLALNDRLWANGRLALDLVGMDGVLAPTCLHNVLWDGKQLVLFDFGLLDARAANPVYAALSRFLRALQRRLVYGLLERAGVGRVGRRPRPPLRSRIPRR